MKKVITILLFSFIFSAYVFSQTNVNLSVRAGVNYSTYISKYYHQNPQNIALLAEGISAEIDFGQTFLFQTEINLIQKGYRYSGGFSNSQRYSFSQDVLVKINWLETPFLIKFKFISKGKFSLSPFGGLSLGVGLSGQTRNSYNSWVYPPDNSPAKNSKGIKIEKVKFIKEHSIFDLAYIVGGEIRYDNLYLDLRLQQGVNDTKSNYFTTRGFVPSKTRGLALTVGYLFYTKTPKKSVSTSQ